MKIKKNTLLSAVLFLYLVALTAYQRENVSFDQYFQVGTFILLMVIYFLSELCSSKNIRISSMAKWYFLFLVYSFASVLWAKYSRIDVFFYSKRMIQILGYLCVIPIFFNGKYNNKQRINLYLKLIVASLVYAGILLISRTPLSAWGIQKAGVTIGVDKNVLGTRMAIGAIISLYLYSKEKRKYHLIIIAVMVMLSLLSGSKKAIFMLVVGISLYEIWGDESKKASRVLGRLFAVLVSMAIIWYLIFNVEVFYNSIGVRLIRTERYLLSGGATFDNSTRERQYYISIAQNLFLEHPILGVGLNNFKSYIAETGYKHVAYSHNNYWEMLSCLGIPGIILLYGFQIKLLITLIRNAYRNKDSLTVLCLIILILYLICDYANVSYMNIFQYIIIFAVYKCTTSPPASRFKNQLI